MADKNIIQSRLLTGARYRFSVQENRIVFRIMEAAQSSLKGLKLSDGIRYQANLFGDIDFEMPLSAFIPEDVSIPTSEAATALRSLFKKDIEINTANEWFICSYIERPHIDKNTGICKFRVSAPIWQAFLDFSKGFDTYFLNVAMSFSSSYSMRWYQLLASNEKPITYSVDWIRKTFQLGNKYTAYKDLRNKVIDVAIDEINEKSDVHITYTELFDGVGRGRKSVKALTFTTSRKRPADEIENMQKIMRKRNYTVRGLIDNRVVDYLQNTFFFSDKELIANAKHIYAAQQRLSWEGLIDKLAALRADCRQARSPKGYVITSLKNCLLNA